MRKRLCRELVIRLRQDRNKMLIDYQGGTLAERMQAQHNAEQPSTILQDIVASANTTASTETPTEDDFHQRAINYLRTSRSFVADTAQDISADYITSIDEEDYNDDPEAGNSGLLKVLRSKKASKANRMEAQTLQKKIQLAQKQKAAKQKAKVASGSRKGKEKAIDIDMTDSDDEVVEVEGDVCEADEHDEETSSSIDVGQVRLAFMRRILAPIMEEREMKKWFDVSLVSE